MCWKALHFGLVQQFVRYPNVSRSLSHYYAGLETGDAQAVGLMVMKVSREERGRERESGRGTVIWSNGQESMVP